MQIHAIHIHHLLSFDTFAWEKLDPHLNVIVGPNGAGKTNLFHALRAVRDALSPERAQATARWANAGHQGMNADTITVALDLQFTTAWEQRLLCAFLATVLGDQQAIQQTISTATQRGLDPDSLKRFDAWVQEHLRPEHISWLFTGRLVITHAGRARWQCRYEALSEKPIFRMELTSGGTLGTLVGHAEHNPQTTTQNWGSLFAAWRASLTEQERMHLDNGLTGATPEGSFPMPDLSRLPDWVSSQQGVALQIVDEMQIVDSATLATRRAFTSAAQISLDSGKPFGMRSVFQRLLEQALVFTDNVRLPYQREFSTSDLHAQPFDLSNGKELARFLFHKKNGGPKDREQYKKIDQMFSRMTGRWFAVVQHPAEISTSQQEPQLDISLELVTINSWGDIPLELSGAGIAEALFLSAVLAGSSGQVVLLDEPALNLHPTTQATLLDELQALTHQSEGEGSQFLVNTHAPTLVPPDTIDRVSRFTLQDGHTIRRALNVRKEDVEAREAERRDVREISQDDLVKLRQMLRGNLAARALLFSRAVLLIEGSTELAALPVWCADLVRQDIALYPVDGKGGFVSPLRFIYHFAIPWAIIGDSEVLWDRQEQKQSGSALNHIRDILTVCRRPLPSISGDPGGNVRDFAEFRQTLETYGIFTLASSAGEGFEKAIRPEILPDIWTDAETKFGKNNKVALSRFIAERCPCPKKVTKLVQKVMCQLREQGADIRIPDEDSPT